MQVHRNFNIIPQPVHKVHGVVERIIVFQMGQAQWADTGTALKSTALARPGPLGIVPVPRTARSRARAWAAHSAHGPARGTTRKKAWPGIGTASSHHGRWIPRPLRF